MSTSNKIAIDGRSFMTGPLGQSPFCGTDEFGLLMVTRRGYRKRCRRCFESEAYPLPALDRKVVYLDQFVISQMMKALHPGHRDRLRPNDERYFLELFDELDRLVKLQVLACPSSHFHWEESFLAPHFYDDLRRTYGHLSADIEFADPAVKNEQRYEAFGVWLGEEPRPSSGRPGLAGDTSAWMITIRIDTRLDPEADHADDVRLLRDHGRGGIGEQFDAWRSGPRRSFADYYEEQVAAYGRGEIRHHLERLAKLAELLDGGHPLDLDIVVATNTQVVIQQLKRRLELHGVPSEEHYSALEQFYASEQARAMPFLRISCGILAAFAVRPRCTRRRARTMAC
jgi:hypothetical protein